jgi:uncharacterized membrane protein YbhN (UPF0104 family)
LEPGFKSGRPVNYRSLVPKAIVTGLILAAIVWWLPMADVWLAMKSVGWPRWLLVLCAFGAGHALAAFKWWNLVRASCRALAYREALRAHLAGLFANIWLPSIVGGDLVRAGWIARRHGFSAPVLIGMVDRVLDLSALLILALLGLVTVGVSESGIAWAALRNVLLVLVGGGVLACALVYALGGRRLPARLQRRMAEPMKVVATLRNSPGRNLAMLLLSISVQMLFVGLNFWLGRAMGIEVSFATWLLAWPLAKIVALAPVSLGGLGVREAALAALLAPFAVPATLAIAQALLWQSVLFGFGLLGGLLTVTGWPGHSGLERRRADEA